MTDTDRTGPRPTPRRARNTEATASRPRAPLCPGEHLHERDRRALAGNAIWASKFDKSQGARTARGPGRPERADHEGRAASVHHPGALPPEYAEELSQLQARRRRWAGPFVATHGSRVGAGLAEPLRQFSNDGGGLGLAWPGAQAPRCMTATSWPASCNTRTCNPQCRPTSTSSTGCSRSTSAWTRPSTPRNRRELSAAPARGTGLRTRSRATKAMASFNDDPTVNSHASSPTRCPRAGCSP